MVRLFAGGQNRYKVLAYRLWTFFAGECVWRGVFGRDARAGVSELSNGGLQWNRNGKQPDADDRTAARLREEAVRDARRHRVRQRREADAKRRRIDLRRRPASIPSSRAACSLTCRSNWTHIASSSATGRASTPSPVRLPPSSGPATSSSTSPPAPAFSACWPAAPAPPASTASSPDPSSASPATWRAPTGSRIACSSSSPTPPTPTSLNAPTFSSATRSDSSDSKPASCETVADVRTRLLKPGGRIIPGRVTMYLAPVETPALRDGPGVLGRRPRGFQLRARARHRRQQRPPCPHRAGSAARPGRRWRRDRSADGHRHAVRLRARPSRRRATACSTASAAGSWPTWPAAITMTNAPGDREPDRSAQRRVSRSTSRCRCAPATPCTVSMRIRPSDLLVRWTVEAPEAGGFRTRRSPACSFRVRISSEPVPPSRRASPIAAWRAGRCSSCATAGRSTRSSAKCYERHRDLFDSEAAAHVFVAEVVTRYCV